MHRTIRLMLQPTPEQQAMLLETTVQFTSAFNAVCSAGWNAGEKNGVRLHHLTYYGVRASCLGLVSDLVVQARVKATEALRSAFALLKRDRKVSCPRTNWCPPRYNHHTATLKWGEGTVRLSTAGGRVTIPFVLPPYYTQYIGGRTLTADLMYRRGRWFLHVAVELPDVEFLPSGNAIGVDMGLTRPAVASNNLFLGSKLWREIDRRYFRLKRALQAKGTSSAKRHLRKLAGKANRFRRDCDHVLSRRIVESVQPGTVIVVENLGHIRSRVKQRGRESRRRLHSWSFAQLRAFLAYKAQAHGCKVEGIDPRHTSQACSRCGHIHRSNRRSQSRFLCRACGFELNADLNASRNIARKYLAGGGMTAAGGPLSTGLSQPDPGVASL